MKLNQVIAIEKGIKSKANAEKSELYKAAQKPSLFNGFSKKYKPRDESGETHPPESMRVQYKAHEVLETVGKCLTSLFDVEATKDYANCHALADVVVDGHVIVEKAPVTFLLNLEKELTDLYTFISTLPILDPAEEWKLDDNSRMYKAEPSQTSKTKKVQKAIVLYPHSEQHPAQTQLITDDETVGHWEQQKMSGAIPEPKRRELLTKVEKLQSAAKSAREQANMVEAEQKRVGEKIVGWLLAN